MWSNLESLNRDELINKYKTSYKKFLSSEKELKSQSLLTLYKSEAFAATF